MTITLRADPYDIETATPGFRDYLQRYAAASERTRAQRNGRLDIAYGDGPAEKLDIFLADVPDAPILVYLHSGGWKGGNKNDRSFPAEAFCPAGAVWVSQEYPLAPAASLDEMVRSVQRGIAWVYANAASFGGDGRRMFLCGNSAGGHLAAMAMVTDWNGQWGLPADLIKGVTTLSGVFDMVPLMQAGANGWLHLDRAAALRNSPIHATRAADCPLICAVGADEPPAFVEQSRSFAAAWRGRGNESLYLPMPGLHHFSIIAELGEPKSALLAAMFAQIGLK